MLHAQRPVAAACPEIPCIDEYFYILTSNQKEASKQLYFLNTPLFGFFHSYYKASAGAISW